MASRTAENVAALQVFGLLSNVEVMNDFYYHFASPPTDTQLTDMVSIASDLIEETWLPLFPDNWAGRSILAFDMTVNDGLNAVSDQISQDTGTAAGDALPNNVTIAIARKNGQRGRSGNGRIFWQGIAQGKMADDNHITAGAAAAYVAALVALDTAMEGAGCTPVILSFQKDGVVSTAATVYPLVDWICVNRRTDSRRKRLPKS